MPPRAAVAQSRGLTPRKKRRLTYVGAGVVALAAVLALLLVSFISTLVQKLLNASVPAYVLATLAFALALLVMTWVQQRRGKAGTALRPSMDCGQTAPARQELRPKPPA
mgnify:CR=1 FL=1